MTKKKMKLIEAKIAFNDISMRELGLDIDDLDHLYDMDTESVYIIKDKYIKYSIDEYPIINHNEMDMNLIENPRLMEMLFGMWITKWQNRKHVEVTSYYQSVIRGSNTGFFVLTYIENGETKELKSDVFINESLRIFSLIIKINHRTKMYDLTPFDFEIPRKGAKK